MAAGESAPLRVMQMAYRPDIDGLRAIAVLAVLAFHFQVQGFSGGFVGVDIFFVISGYLIGTHLLKELADTGRVSLASFYMRRIRRIAPAWMALCFVVMGVGYLVLLPHDLRELGKTVFASVLLGANIQFYRSSGYFDSAVDEKPLLHMWSLAVEEQFYLFLPLLMLLLWRQRATGSGLIVVALVSFIACLAMTAHNHTAAFFLLPFRAWELLAGVLLARYRIMLTGAAAQVAAWTGAGMIALSVGFISGGSAFPGILAVFPVGGAALLIAAGQSDTLPRRFLANRPMIAIGLISYSLYLWHWPLISFARLIWDDAPPAGLWLALVVASFVLGWASWRWVERPTRNSQRLPGRWLLGGMGAGSAALIAVGLVAYVTNGLPGRWSPTVLQYANASQDFIQDWSRCSTPQTGPLAGVETCSLGPEGEPQILIWGDSHARAMKEGLDLAASEAGVPVRLIWHAGCPPLIGVSKKESAATGAEDAACRRDNDRIMAAMPQLPDRILLIGRWSYYAEGRGVGLDSHNLIELQDESDTAQPYVTAVTRTLDWLRASGKQVYVLRQMPEIAQYHSASVARRLARGGQDMSQVTVVSRELAEKRAASGHAPFAAQALAGLITLIDAWPLLCTSEFCSAVLDQEVVYFDNNHMTNHGAMLMRDLFKSIFSFTENVS